MRVDVFLDSGVCVEVPDGTDVYSKEGYALVKELGRQKLLAMLNDGDFDVGCEVYEND